MSNLDLDMFHETSGKLDFRGSLNALLGEFRRGNIADRSRVKEAAVIQTHLAQHREAWDRVFPEFPEAPWKRRTLTAECHRGRRDAYLRQLIVDCVTQEKAGDHLIVNPATVAGVHAGWLARVLPAFEVVGTDIDSRWSWLYRLLFWKHRRLKNYRFVRESVFEPDPTRRPVAVTFFGACGSVTDGGMDYAIAVASPFLICRSCCHENIGGNTTIVRRRGRPVNEFFAWKNYWFARYRRKRTGFYFSDRYTADAYPRSRAAREIVDSDTMIAVARNTPDSDVCRSIIDLDRCLFLRENGYDVMYREELFFAHRRTPSV